MRTILPVNITLLAAGAGGMICGSCLRDNTLAKALLRAGHQATLVPLYTPLRTDTPNVAIRQVFYGGVNAYLQYASPVFRHTPRFIDWLLDRNWLLKWAGGRGAQTSPASIGPFVLSILQGEHGPQVKELRRLVRHLRKGPRPDIVSIPSALFLGLARALRDGLGAPVVCELTGEDIFLEAMADPYKSQARDAIRSRAADADRFVATSRYYADRMADYLSVPRDRIDVVYPGVDRAVLEFPSSIQNPKSKIQNPTIGYLARICPEKGLDRLIDALPILRKLPGMERARVRAGGYLGAAHQAWFDALRQHVADQGLADAVEFVGELDLPGKVALLDGVDVLCVPTAYAEPKGIFALEAMSRSTSVVLPDHGAFGEMIQHTGGGILVPPGDPHALAQALAALLRDPDRRAALGAAGRRAVRQHFTDDAMAAAMVEVYRRPA